MHDTRADSLFEYINIYKDVKPTSFTSDTVSKNSSYVPVRFVGTLYAGLAFATVTEIVFW